MTEESEKTVNQGEIFGNENVIRVRGARDNDGVVGIGKVVAGV